MGPFTPGSPGSDLNRVIRTDCMCSVKCAEAAWNYKSGRYIVHYKLPAFYLFYFKSYQILTVSNGSLKSYTVRGVRRIL